MFTLKRCACAAILAAVATASCVAYRAYYDRHFWSSVLQQGSTRYPLKAEIMRSQFVDLSLAVIKPRENHTHAQAAADRSSASAFADRYGATLGLTPYFVQCSRADERSGRVGSRAYYWSKDLVASPSPDKPPDNALHVFVDVDQYVDMPAFLVKKFAPTLIYTFQPEQVAKVGLDYSYTFDAEDRVDYRVTGGGTFQHQVWNYAQDHLLVSKTCLGLPYKIAVFLIDRRATATPDHELIMLTPVAKWTGWQAILASLILSGRSLARLVVHNKGFLRLETHRTSGVFRSTARVASYAQATIPVADDDALRAIVATSKIDLTMPQVMSFVDGDRVAASALLEFHRSKLPTKPDIVFPVPQSTHRYQFNPSSYDVEAKPAMLAFMSPIIHECYVPDMCLNNEQRCVQARIVDVRSNPELTPIVGQYMLEFVKLFLPDPHLLDPVDDDELYRRQARPTQRRILEEASCMTPKRQINMFLKKEAYSEPKDPRPISTINGVDKAAYSKFIYALAEVVKAQPWYAFGLSPVDIAKRLVVILAPAKTAAKTDLSRFDGRVTAILREFEQMILVRGFRAIYHDTLLALHRSQSHLPAFGTFGTVYDTEDARCSGSPETAAFNSLINAFMAYMALRMGLTDGVHLTPAAAYARLGIYGGDDGVTTDIDPELYVKACAMVGQKLTIEIVKRGEIGVQFLARVYGPNVWFGDAASCCDLPRQLSKFHATVALPPNVTPLRKLVEKARSFYLSDRYTPIIGPFVTKVMQIADVHYADLTTPLDGCELISTWNSMFPVDLQYPNDYADWMLAYANSALPEFDFVRYESWLGRIKVLQDCLSPPLCIEPKPAKSATPVVVDGDVVSAVDTGRKVDMGKIAEKPQTKRKHLPHAEQKRRANVRATVVQTAKPNVVRYVAVVADKAKGRAGKPVVRDSAHPRK